MNIKALPFSYQVCIITWKWSHRGKFRTKIKFWNVNINCISSWQSNCITTLTLLWFCKKNNLFWFFFFYFITFWYYFQNIFWKFETSIFWGVSIYATILQLVGGRKTSIKLLILRFIQNLWLQAICDIIMFALHLNLFFQA